MKINNGINILIETVLEQIANIEKEGMPELNSMRLQSRRDLLAFLIKQKEANGETN